MMFIFWRFVFRPIVRALSRVYRWRQWVAVVALVGTMYGVGEYQRAHGLNGADPTNHVDVRVGHGVTSSLLTGSAGSCVTGSEYVPPACTATVLRGSKCVSSLVSGRASSASVVATILVCRSELPGETCVWTCL